MKFGPRKVRKIKAQFGAILRRQQRMLIMKMIWRGIRVLMKNHRGTGTVGNKFEGVKVVQGDKTS
jgi:hypothetical protein